MRANGENRPNGRNVTDWDGRGIENETRIRKCIASWKKRRDISKLRLSFSATRARQVHQACMPYSSYDGILNVTMLPYEIRAYNVVTPVNRTAGMEISHSSDTPLAEHACYRIVRMIKVLQQEYQDMFGTLLLQQQYLQQNSNSMSSLPPSLCLSLCVEIKSRQDTEDLLSDIARWASYSYDSSAHTRICNGFWILSFI